jgi:hypothetical protein
MRTRKALRHTWAILGKLWAKMASEGVAAA